MHNKYMDIALEEAIKAYNENEIPVGAVVVKNGEVISRAHNIKEKTNVATNHAEIIAINEACKKLNTWRLNDCEIYVTLEPCLMCAGALLQSRMGKLVYSVENSKFGYVSSVDKILNNKNNHKISVEKGVGADKSNELLTSFFMKIRSEKMN